jgi:hypothetical protein
MRIRPGRLTRLTDGWAPARCCDDAASELAVTDGQHDWVDHARRTTCSRHERASILIFFDRRECYAAQSPVEVTVGAGAGSAVTASDRRPFQRSDGHYLEM